MPTAQISWEEWHITDGVSMNECAEYIFGATPSYRSTIGRFRDDNGIALYGFDIYMSDGTVKTVPAGSWVVLMGGTIQVMSNEQHNSWRGV